MLVFICPVDSLEYGRRKKAADRCDEADYGGDEQLALKVGHVAYGSTERKIQKREPSKQSRV